MQFAAENDSEVALLAEGVDRNSLVIVQPRSARVALLAEGVDRNIAPARYALWSGMSPSSRRAWIEISVRVSISRCREVALLAEGVDRNRPTRMAP